MPHIDPRLFINIPEIQYIHPWQSVSGDEAHTLDILLALEPEMPKLAVVHLTWRTSPSPDKLFPHLMVFDSISNFVSECMDGNPQYCAPVKTRYGYLFGRDAIYLDDLEFESVGTNLHLSGTINHYTTTQNIRRELPYRLSFIDIMALKMVEFDSWDYRATSSFDEVMNSTWQAQLGGKVTKQYKHYLLQTYDDVFDIICRRYRLDFPH